MKPGDQSAAAEPSGAARPYDEQSTRLPGGLGKSVAGLTATVIVALLGIGAFAHAKFGPTGGLAAALAAVICYLAALGALLVAAFTAGRPSGATGALLGIGLRTGIPLIAAIGVPAIEPRLGAAGFFPLVLSFYLICLAVETVLSVRLIQRQQQQQSRIKSTSTNSGAR